MAEIKHADQANFQEEVLNHKGTVLVYFWAEWCGPCKVMSPNAEEFAKGTDAVKVVKINVDENQQLAQSYNIMSIPTVLVFKDGNVSGHAVGLQSIEQMKEMTA